MITLIVKINNFYYDDFTFSFSVFRVIIFLRFLVLYYFKFSQMLYLHLFYVQLIYVFLNVLSCLHKINFTFLCLGFRLRFQIFLQFSLRSYLCEIISIFMYMFTF